MDDFLKLLARPLSPKQVKRIERQIENLMKDDEYLKEIKVWEATIGDGIYAEE